MHAQAKGKEFTKYYRKEHSSGKNGSTYYVPVVNELTIFEVKLPLLGKGNLAPGNYEFPVAFQLAPNLPGSFDFHGTHNNHEAM